MMEKMGFPHHIIRLISTLYSDHESTVQTCASLTEWIPIGRGVKQGCIQSLMLFNMYSKDIMLDALEELADVTMNGKWFQEPARFSAKNNKDKVNGDWQGPHKLHRFCAEWWADRGDGWFCLAEVNHQYPGQLYVEDQEKAGNSQKCYDKNGKHLEYLNYAHQSKVRITMSHWFCYCQLWKRVMGTYKEGKTLDWCFWDMA